MEKKFEITRVSARGQVTIPKDIRKIEDIEDGDKMLVTYVQGYVVMKKMKESMMKDFFETMKKIGKHVSMEDVKSSRKESKKSLAKKTEKW